MDINAILPVDIKNKWEFELRNTVTGKVKKYESYNTVKDAYYNRLITGTPAQAINVIQIGDGTGTPSSGNTPLFNVRGRKNCTGVHISATKTGSILTGIATFSMQLNETEANGDISEVGLAANATNTVNFTAGAGGTLMTHSVITDAQNDPMVIIKTNLDVLTIVATVYFIVDCNETNMEFVEFTRLMDAPFVPIRKSNSNWLVSSGTMGVTARVAPSNTFYYLVSNPPDIVDRSMSAPVNTATAITTPTSDMIRAHNTVTSQDFNGDNPRLIKSIGVFGAGVIKFPNHNLFPPKRVPGNNRLRIALGNESQTGFNIPFPEVMTGNEEIYIDGVLQPPNTYSFTGKNFEMQQAWVSCDTRYLDPVLNSESYAGINYSVPGLWAGNILASMFSGFQTATGDIRGEIIYDFKTPKMINTFRKSLADVGASIPSIFLKYSDDGINWTEVARFGNNTRRETINFSPISARYWATETTASPNIGTGYVAPPNEPFLWAAFDYVSQTHSLIFDTPPPDGSIIEAVLYTEYPIKNEKYQFQTTINMNMSRT